MNDNEIRLSLIDCSGLTPFSRETIEILWGRGKWFSATLGGYNGELYQAEDGANVFASIETVKEDLSGKQVIVGPRTGTVHGVIFVVSNDGGKTGVAWRDNVFDAFKYLDLQNVNGGNYAVVAVRKQ